MTEAEIRQAENIARHHINRIKTIQARTQTRPWRATDVGIVPSLCQMILALTAELKANRQATR